jgi:PAS domain S-box-containing protein
MLRELVTPPLVEDEEFSGAARIIHFVLLGLVGGVALVMAVHTYTDGHAMVAGLLLVMQASALYAFSLNRRGQFRKAMYVILFGLLLTTTIMVVLSENGLHDNAMLIYPSTLVIASLLLDKRFLVLYAAATIFVMLLIGAAELSGILVSKMSSYTKAQDLVDLAVILGLTAVTVGLLIRNLRENVARARNNELALAGTNAELERQAQYLRESEERFRVTFEQAAVGIAHVDMDGKFVRVNQRWCDILKYSRVELLQRTDKDITHPEHLEGEPRDAWELLTGQVDHYSKEKKYIRKDGTPIWVNLTVSLVRDADGLPKYLITVIEDISVRKQVEDELWKLNEGLEMRVAERTAELQAANRELESFSYSVSHDLRAPLRHISGYLELLKEDGGHTFDEKSHRYLEMAAQSAVRLGHLIDDLLAFSRVGRAEVKKTEVDIRKMVEEVKVELEGGEGKGRKIEWRIGAMPVVQADPVLMRQVMTNLLSNAVKFTRKREVAQIEVGSMPEREGDRGVTLYVRDNGAGFDMKYEEKLFGVFQRLHNADEFEGTGIGLANVRRIIQRHGGRVWAEGAIDQGATFYVALSRVRHGQ